MYLWLKAFHIVAVIAFMAGVFYLPRLFVYHSGVAVGSEASETFKVMERRLLKAIMLPSLIAVWLSGLWLAYDGGWFRAPWLHGKLALVIALSALHGYLSASARRFAADERPLSAKRWRILNEVPTVLLLGIVILVVVKPF